MNGNNNNDKKARNCTDTGVLHKAKLLFYQDMKNDDDVMKIVKQKNKELTKVDFKNWRIVKEVTDTLFDKLSATKKENYMNKAKEAKNNI
jgi:hypothetical protein